MSTYTVTKMHSTKWAVVNPAGETIATAKTKGAAQAIADKNIAEAAAVKKATKAAKVPGQRKQRVYAALTRKQCVARLKELGDSGPTSYLMPKLRAIVAEVEKNGPRPKKETVSA